MWQYFDEKHYVRSTWAGGETCQLCIYPEGANYAERQFGYRISTATVTLPESDFTALPGVKRHLTILEGVLELSHDDGPWLTLNPFEIHSFDGGVKTSSRGQVRDFNLMTKPGFNGVMLAIQAGENPRQHFELEANVDQWLFIVNGQADELKAGQLLKVAGSCSLTNMSQDFKAVYCRINLDTDL